MYIKPVKARGKTFYIVCTESGAEVMLFYTKARAEAWLRNEIYA